MAVHPIGSDGSVGCPPVEWLETATGALDLLGETRQAFELVEQYVYGSQDRFELIVRPIGLPGTNSSLNLPMLEFPVIICQPGVAQSAPRDLRALV